MSAEILETHFDIKPEASIHDGRHVRYIVKDSLYTIIPVTHLEQDVLIELYEMSEHMAKLGDLKVATFVPSKDEKFLITYEKQDLVVMHNRKHQPSRQRNIGRKLAKFHERGKYIQVPISATSRVGQWKSLWIKRLEQMETVWRGLVQEQIKEKFEKSFVESFPYYLGLCENAIQYITDTELDEEPAYSDRGTVCHERFYDGLWNTQLEIRDPFDWTFDHCGRDLSEWIRDRYFRRSGTIKAEMEVFIQGYESRSPLTTFAWRLIYARLLFPLHYFECVEEYFLTSSQWTQKQLEERLDWCIRYSKEYELFLRSFFDLAGADRRKLPVVEWL